MKEVSIGFVPLHRYPFDERWAAEIKERVVKSVKERLGHVRLVYPDESLTKMGLVWDDDDALKVVDLFRRKGVQGILIGTMTFGDELAGALVAEELRGKPIMVFGTREPEILPGGLRRSDSFCGTLSLASALYRRKIPFMFAGILLPEEEQFARKLDVFARASSIVEGFVGARIGIVGPRPERFETVTFNEAKMAELYKQRVVNFSLLQVVEEARRLDGSDPLVREIADEMAGQADISEVPAEVVDKMARLEAVLRRLAEEKRLDGIGFRCWTEIEEYFGITPCFVMGRLTQAGIMASCEVDVYGALTMLVQYRASLESTPPHFIDWTIQHPTRPNTFLAWHCGNAPPGLACPTCPVRIRHHSIMDRAVGVERSYGTGEFGLRPGPVTICRLVEYDGEFKMLIARGRVVEEDLEVRGSWSWVEVEDLDRLYRTLVEEGFVHHASMIHGDYAEPIGEACRLLGIRTVAV